MRRLAVALALLAAAPAGASSLEGTGRVTLEAGWRLTPNDYFYARARAAGFPKEHDSPGGPALMGTFGYMVTEQIELCIDLFAGGEFLHLTGAPPLASLSYGGMVGGRYHLRLGEDFEAFGGLQFGPALILATNGPLPSGVTSEAAVGSYLGSVGLAVHLSDQWGLSLEYRLLLARGYVPGISGFNGGGSWFGLGVTWYSAAQPSGPTLRR